MSLRAVCLWNWRSALAHTVLLSEWLWDSFTFLLHFCQSMNLCLLAQCDCVCSREQRVPNKDLVKLFIRAHALRSNSLVNSPWVVDENFVRKHSLPPVVYPSPHKVFSWCISAVYNLFVVLMLFVYVTVCSRLRILARPLSVSWFSSIVLLI